MADQPLSSSYKEETTASSQGNKQSEKRKPDPVLKAEANTNSYKRMKLKCKDPVETGNGSPPKEKKPKHKEASSTHVSEQTCHSHFSQAHSTRVKGDYNSMHSSASGENVSSVSGVGRADYFPPEQSLRPKSKTNLKYFDNVISKTDLTKKKSSDYFPPTDSSRPKSKPNLALLSGKDENDPGLKESLSSRKSEEILSNFKKPHKDSQKSLQNSYKKSSVKSTYHTSKTMKKNEIEPFSSQTTGESVAEKTAEEVTKLKQEILEVLVKACDSRASLKRFERKYVQVKNICKIVQEPEKAVNSNLPQSSSNNAQEIPKECMRDNMKNLTAHTMKTNDQKLKNTEVIRTHLQEEHERSTVMIEEGKKGEKEPTFKIISKAVDLNFVKQTNQNPDSKPLKAVTSEMSLHKTVNNSTVNDSENLEGPTGKLEVINFSDHAIHLLKSEKLDVSKTNPNQFDKKINLHLSNNSLKKALHLLYMKATSNKLRKSESIQSNLQCHSNEHSVGKEKHLIKLEGKSKSSDEEGSSKQSESEPSLRKGKKPQVTGNTQHTKHSPKSSIRDPEWDVVVNEEMKEHNLENKPSVTRIASLRPELQITGDKKLKSGDNKMTDRKEKDDMKKVNLDDKALSRGSKFNDAAKGEQELPKQAEMKPSISEENKKVKVGLNAIKETGVNQKGVFGRIKVIDLRFKDGDNLSDNNKPEELKGEGSSEVPKKLSIALKPKPQIDTSTQVSTERLPSSETKSTQTDIDSGPFTSTNNIPTLNAGTEASGKQVVFGMKEASTQTVKTKHKLNTALPSKEVEKKDTINLHEEYSKNLKASVIRTKESGEADSHKRVIHKLRKTPDKKQASSIHVPPVIIKTYKPEGLNEVTQEFVKSDYIEPEMLEKETKSPLELLKAEVRRKRENTSAEHDKLLGNVRRKSKRVPKQPLAATTSKSSTKKSVKKSKEELKSSQTPEVIKKLADIVKEPVIPTSTEYSLTEDEKSKITCSTSVVPSRDLVSKTPDETQPKQMLEENVPKSIKTVHVHSQDTNPSEGDTSRQTKASLAANSNTIKKESKVSETPTVHRETKQQSLPEKISTDTEINESSRITNKIKQSHLSEKVIIDSKISEPPKLAREMRKTSPEKPNVETKISVTPTHTRETKQSSLPEKSNVETKISVTPTHARETKQSSLHEKPDIDTNISEPSKHTREIKQSSLSEKPNTHAKILEPSKFSREEKQSILHENPNIDTKMSESSRHATEIKQSTLAEKPKTDTKLSEPSKHAREKKQSALPEKPTPDMKLSETSRHSREIKQPALPEIPKIETKISEPAREIKQSTSSEKPNIDPKISQSSRHTRETNQSTPPQKTNIVTKKTELSRNSREIKQLTSPEKPNIGTKISEAPKNVGEIKQLTSSEKRILDAKTSEPHKTTTEINRSRVSEKPYADSKVDKPPRHTDDILHASLVDKPHTEEKLPINQSPVSEKPYTDSKMAEPLRPAKDIKVSPLSEKPSTDPKQDESCRDAKQYTSTKIDESSKYSREQSPISEKPHTDPKKDEPPRQAREIKQPTLSEKPHTDPKRDEPLKQAREIKEPTLSEKPHTDPKSDEPLRQVREIKQPTLSEKPHTDPKRDELLRQATEIKQPTLSEKPHTDPKRDELFRQATEIKQPTLSEKPHTDPKRDEPPRQAREIKQPTLSEKPHTDPKRDDEPCKDAKQYTGTKIDESPKYNREQSPISEKPHTDPKRNEPLRQAREIKQPTLSEKPHTDPKRDEPHTDPKRDEPLRQAREIKEPTLSEKPHTDPKSDEPLRQVREIKQPTLSEKPHTDPKRDELLRQATEIKQPTLSEKPHTDPKRDELFRQATEIKQPTLSEKPHTDLKKDEPPRYAKAVKQSTLTEKSHAGPKIDEPPRQAKEIKQLILLEKLYTEPKMDESHRHTREIKQSTVPEKPYTDQKVSETPRLSIEIKQSPESETLKTDSKLTETPILSIVTKQPSVSDKQTTNLKLSETLRHKDANQSPTSEEPSTDSKMSETRRLFTEIKPPPPTQKQNIDPKVPETLKVLGEIEESPVSRKTDTDKTSINKYLEAERRKGGTDNNDMVTKDFVKEEYTKITPPKNEEKPKHKVTADQQKLQDESISKLEKLYESIATPKLQLKQQQSVKPTVIMTTPKDAKASKESTKHQKNIELVSSKGSEHRPHSERPSLRKNFIAETMKKAEEERGHQVFDTKNLHEGALYVKNAYDTVKKSTTEERNAENAASPKSVVKQIEEKENVSKKSVQEEAARYTVKEPPNKSKMQAQNEPEIKVCILPETQKKAVGKDPDNSVTQEQSTKTSPVAKVTLQPDQKGPVSTHIKSSAKENIINAKQTTESIVEKYEQVIKKQIPMFESEQRNTLEKSLGELAPAEPPKYFPSAIHGKDVLFKGEKDEKDRWKTNDDKKKSEQNELNSKELNKKPSVKDTAAIKLKEEPLVETYFVSKNFNRFFDSSHELTSSSNSKAFTSDSTKSESDGQQGSEKKQPSILGLKTNVVSEVRYKIDKSKKKDISHTKYTKIMSSESFKAGKQNRPTGAQGSQHPCIKTYLVSEFSRNTKSSENFRLDQKPIDTEPLKTKDFRVLQGDKVKDEKPHRMPEDYQNEKSNGHQITVKYDTGDQSSQKNIHQVSVDSKSSEGKKLDPRKLDSGEPQSSVSGHQTRDESNEDNDPQTDTEQKRNKTTDEQLEAAKELITKHLEMERAMAPYLKHDQPKVVEYYKSKYMKDSVKNFLKAEGLERNTSKKEEKSTQGSSSEWKGNVVTAKYLSKGLSRINKQYLHPENKVLSQFEESKPLKKVKSPKKDLSLVAKEYLRPSFISAGPLPPSPMPPSPYPPLPLPPIPPPSPTPPSPVPSPPLELESVSNEKDCVKPVSSDVTKTENLHNKSRTIIQGISNAGMKVIQEQEFERDKKSFEKSRVKLSKQSFVPVDESNPTDTEGLREPIKNLHLIENDIVTRTFKEIAPPLPKREKLFPLRITSSKSITDNVSLEERLQNRTVTSVRDDNRLIPRPSTSAKLYPSSRYHEYRMADQRPNEQWDYDDPQLRGLSRHFNSSTIRGRANTAKATFLLVGLLSIYFLMKPESPPCITPVEGQPQLPPSQFQEPQLQQPYQLAPSLPPSEQQPRKPRPSE